MLCNEVCFATKYATQQSMLCNKVCYATKYGGVLKMLRNIAKDISTLLQVITNNVFVDEMPDDMNNVITVYHSGGNKSNYYFGNERQIENPSIQVRVRHTNRKDALDWCYQIKNILDGKSNFFINNNHYILVTLSSDILNLGRDNQGRVHYSVNFAVQVKRNS